MSHINIMMVAVMMLASIAVRAESKVGQVVLTNGVATIRHVSGAATPAVFGAEVQQMDALETKAGTMKILFDDKTLLTLGNNSKVLVTEYVFNPKRGERSTIYDIVSGTVRAIVDQPVALKKNEVRLQTATAVAGIRGTDAGVRVSGKSSRMVCFSGLFEAYAKSNPAGKVMVKTGEWTDISGPVPTVPRPVTADTMRQFSNVLSQVTPPPASAQPAKTQQQPFAPEAPQTPQQPQTPPMLPGGSTNTPPDAGSGQTNAPLTFPQ